MTLRFDLPAEVNELAVIYTKQAHHILWGEHHHGQHKSFVFMDKKGRTFFKATLLISYWKQLLKDHLQLDYFAPHK